MQAKIILTIAGSDPSAGAGIQADIKTISALGGYALTAISALTAQNTQGVTDIHAVPASFIKSQLNALLEDIHIDAIKIGMLHNAEVMQVVADFLQQLPETPVVLDPVIVATSGDCLLAEDSLEVMLSQLFPLATLVTPNLTEALRLCHAKSVEYSHELMHTLSKYRSKAVLVKDSQPEQRKCIDLLYLQKNQELIEFSLDRVSSKNTHGTGCTLSAAIAFFLGSGYSIKQAVKEAKQYVYGAIQHGKATHLGHGHGPLQHFYRVKT